MEMYFKLRNLMLTLYNRTKFLNKAKIFSFLMKVDWSLQIKKESINKSQIKEENSLLVSYLAFNYYLLEKIDNAQ